MRSSIVTLRLLLLASLAGLAAATPASASAPPIATVSAPSTVAAYGGTLAWSAYDDATRRFTLMVRDDAGVRSLGVATRGAAFDVDLGPGPDGTPVAVYSRCAADPTFAEPLGYRGCRLYRYDLPGGPEQAIPIRRPAGFSDAKPAIWRGRLAWVRRADSGPGGDRPQVLVGAADGSGTPRPLSLITLHRCWRNYDPSPPTICGPTRRRSVRGLDLSPAGVAISQEYLCPAAPKFGRAGCGGGGGGFYETELTMSTAGGHLRRLADSVAGLGGQIWTDPVFSGGGLYFARACLGDPGGCARGGSRIVRYDLRTHRYTRSPGPPRLYGLGLGAGHVFELLEPQPDRGCSLFYVAASMRPPGQGPCELIDAGAPAFARYRGGRSP